MTPPGASGMHTPCGAGVAVDAAFRLLEIASLSATCCDLHAAAMAFGFAAAPSPGHAAERGGLTLMHAAPRRLWLAGGSTAPVEVPGFAVTDISDGLLRFEVRGATVRDWLAQLCPLDLRPRAFASSQVAWTQFAELRVLLHCLNDDAFDLYLATSYASDFISRCLASSGRTSNSD